MFKKDSMMWLIIILGDQEATLQARNLTVFVVEVAREQG